MPKAKKPEEVPVTDAERDAFARALASAPDVPEVGDIPTGTTEGMAPSAPIVPEAASAVPPPAPVKKRNETTGAKHLERMLTDGAGEANAMGAGMEPARRRRIRWPWVLGILGVIAAATLGGFFFFNQPQRFTGNNVKIAVRLPETATSGKDMTITVQIQNAETVDLVRGELTMEYPEGFTYKSSSWPATNEFKNAFDIGRLGTGRTNELTITGTLVGALKSDHAFPATLTFRPSNFNSDFQARGTASVTISASSITVAIDGPTKLAPGGAGTWTVTYTNTSPDTIKQLQIEVAVPEALALTVTKPAANGGTNVWTLSDVASDGTGKITLSGTAKGSAGDSLELIVKAGIVNQGTVAPQDEQQTLIVLVNTGLTTAVAVNGATTMPVIAPGDSLTYTIRVTNKSEAEITDVNVKATLAGAALDLTTLQNTDKGVVKDATLTWTKKEVAGLETLTPGEEVILRLTVSTKATLVVQTDADRDQAVTLGLAVTSPSIPAAGQAPIPSAVVKIGTVFAFQAAARYYDDQGVALGAGPIPPVVGKTTTYRIRWTLTNTTSDVTKFTATATLPIGVFWTGKNVTRDAGDIGFDTASRTVTWTLNKVPAGTGSRLPVIQAGFDVSITPSADQVGTVVVLTDTATANATDGFTAAAIAQTQPSLTTALSGDPKAAGEGIVQSSF